VFDAGERYTASVMLLAWYFEPDHATPEPGVRAEPSAYVVAANAV
jgi:hypothetical protein